MGLIDNHYEANPITNINVNAVSGTLIKTFKDSYFVRFHMNSTFAKRYFQEKNPFRETNGKETEIVIVQCMLCGDGEFLVEVIDKIDYDKIFEIKEENNENN